MGKAISGTDKTIQDFLDVYVRVYEKYFTMQKNK